jgi:hypothetical protein
VINTADTIPALAPLLYSLLLLLGIVLRELVIKQSATVCVLGIILKKGYQGRTGIRGLYGQLFKREVVRKTDRVLP